ncbi:MAG: hypothetical protein Q8O00_02425 [Holophaga sp.]|nr:hypothetical protein [Holophaga sp.]
MNGIKAPEPSSGRVAVIIAHPDDETLWAGGLLLGHPEWSPFIITLCRGGDLDRAPKFRQALKRLNAQGSMGDQDDGPDQLPLTSATVRECILSLLPPLEFDLLLTHGLQGEYTRHRRHEEVAHAVQNLWRDGTIRAAKLWHFAYEDGGGSYLPRPRANADLHLELPEGIWARKCEIMTQVYGFEATSWEARVAPRVEAFRCFSGQGIFRRSDEMARRFHS